MKIITGSRSFGREHIRNPVVTLGNFDGVHLGHQKILRKTIERARSIDGASVVYTFAPHPLNVLRPDREPLKITTLAEKAQLIELTGIDYLISERFTKTFASRTPEDFVTNIIGRRIRPREIVIGQDYAFGKDRKGDIGLLRQMGRKLDYRVHIMKDITIKNIPVRSTTIRNLIAAGKVSLAHKLLGRPYALAGRVIHGQRRQIGFATANLSHIKDLIPRNGVYVIRIETPFGWFNGVVNIGINPTFDLERLSIEAHLFDFNEELYGRDVTLYFIKRIRDEIKFDSVAKLVSRIAKDISFAKRVLTKNHAPACPQPRAGSNK